MVVWYQGFWKEPVRRRSWLTGSMAGGSPEEVMNQILQLLGCGLASSRGNEPPVSSFWWPGSPPHRGQVPQSEAPMALPPTPSSTSSSGFSLISFALLYGCVSTGRAGLESGHRMCLLSGWMIHAAEGGNGWGGEKRRNWGPVLPTTKSTIP